MRELRNGGLLAYTYLNIQQPELLIQCTAFHFLGVYEVDFVNTFSVTKISFTRTYVNQRQVDIGKRGLQPRGQFAVNARRPTDFGDI